MKNYQEPIAIKAHLVAGDKPIPIDAIFSSKYSLLIRFMNGNNFRNGAEFSKLVMRNNGKPVELGPCRLLAKHNIDGYAGRLTFIEDVYDLEGLFFDDRVVKLQTSFLNLPLILAHKRNIRTAFRDYTADLSYDLSVYRTLFDNLDAEYSGEPEEIRDAVQKAIINTEGANFRRFLDEKLDDLEGIVADFSKEEHERHGFYFRKQLWSIILSVPFMARCNLKPRGYAGDSVMMSMLYANDYEGDTTFSKLLHKHPVEHPAAQAVRNRRVVIAKSLLDFRKRRFTARGKKMKILSVACGPAREIQDILSTPKDCNDYHFTLLDQDRKALSEAANSIDRVEKALDTKITATYLNESVRTMLTTPQLRSEWGQFNFIYSMGLFDYLTPPVARAVLGKLYQVLEPGGEMVIGNFHISNPSRCYMEYWLDWVLYYRTEEAFMSLSEGLTSGVATVSFDDTKVQMFLHIKKAP